mmetsp:Transcript_4885/g.11460  ORF Transcript_4885/g.11460 Transcript_4885/m.11460 type:complete len:300 (-) Transcript_4885:409-1308(-)
MRLHERVGGQTPVFNVRQAIEDVLREDRRLQVCTEVVQHKRQHWVLCHIHHDLEVVLICKFNSADRKCGGPVQGDVLWEADEDGLFVEDILAPVQDPPSKHGCREAIDAAWLILSGGCTLVHDAQLALGAVIQPNAPLEEAAQNNPRWGSIHGAAHMADAPLNAFGRLLLWSVAKDAGLVAAPVPLLGLPEQVTRRFHLRMLQAEDHNSLGVSIGGHVMASVLQDLCQILSGDAHQLVLQIDQHLQQMIPHILAHQTHEKWVPWQSLVLHDVHAVLWCQAWHDEWLNVCSVKGLDAEVL